MISWFHVRRLGLFPQMAKSLRHWGTLFNFLIICDSDLETPSRDQEIIICMKLIPKYGNSYQVEKKI